MAGARARTQAQEAFTRMHVCARLSVNVDVHACVCAWRECVFAYTRACVGACVCPCTRIGAAMFIAEPRALR